ncbi:oxidoreductase family, NAD-binding rossmann fold domain-containing protein [Sarocladium implicatum]|nr:oxidoreductase family, NAD-binding rossmann fold domain-containing protein [Sarocladium implicatum]
MSPTRVGIIGLKAIVQDHYSPGTWGLQHLKSLSSSPHYHIVAVCNTSVESAQKAIDIHDIHDAKPYGTAEDIAADPNVDMVLVCVDVGQRYKLLEPVLRHKKHAFIEFPAGNDAAEVKKMAELAEKSGVKVVVGAQGRADPKFSKMRDMIANGDIGDVVSTTLTGSIPIVTADAWPHSQTAFLDINSGISRAKGVLGHVLDTYTSVVGSFDKVQAALKVQDKTAKTLDNEGNVVDPAYPTTSPDTMFIQGVLANGALASLTLRSIRSAVDDTGFRWIVSGTKGEMEYTSGPGIMADLPAGKIRVRTWGGDVEDVSVDEQEPEHVKKVSAPGGNVARVWEAFHNGDGKRAASIMDSLRIHELLGEIIDQGIYAP